MCPAAARLQLQTIASRQAAHRLACDTLSGQHTLHAEAGGFAPPPPLGMQFSERRDRDPRLAVVDEEGRVSILRLADSKSGRQRKPTPSHINCLANLAPDPACVLGVADASLVESTNWLAHNNAAFACCWTHNDAHLVTASGDWTCAVFDVETKARLHQLAGHALTVKCVVRRPGDTSTAAAC